MGWLNFMDWLNFIIINFTFKIYFKFLNFKWREINFIMRYYCCQCYYWNLQIITVIKNYYFFIKIIIIKVKIIKFIAVIIVLIKDFAIKFH